MLPWQLSLILLLGWTVLFDSHSISFAKVASPCKTIIHQVTLGIQKVKQLRKVANWLKLNSIEKFFKWECLLSLVSKQERLWFGHSLCRWSPSDYNWLVVIHDHMNTLLYRWY